MTLRFFSSRKFFSSLFLLCKTWKKQIRKLILYFDLILNLNFEHWKSNIFIWQILDFYPKKNLFGRENKNGGKLELSSWYPGTDFWESSFLFPQNQLWLEREKRTPKWIRKNERNGNEGKLNEHFYSNKNCLGTSFMKHFQNNVDTLLSLSLP